MMTSYLKWWHKTCGSLLRRDRNGWIWMGGERGGIWAVHGRQVIGYIMREKKLFLTKK